MSTPVNTPAPPPERNYDNTGGGESSFAFMRIDTETGEMVLGKDAGEFRMNYVNCYILGFAMKYNDNPGHAKIPKHWEYIFRIKMKDPREVLAAKIAEKDPKSVQAKEFSLTFHSHWKGGLVPDSFNALLLKITDPSWDQSCRFETWVKKGANDTLIPRCALKDFDGTKWPLQFPFADDGTPPDVPKAKDPDFEGFWLEQAKTIQAWFDKVNPSQVTQTAPATTTASQSAPKKTLAEKAIAFLEKAWKDIDSGDLDSLVASGKSTFELLDSKYAADAEYKSAKAAVVSHLNELITKNKLSSTAKFLANGTYDAFVTKPPDAQDDDLPF